MALCLMVTHMTLKKCLGAPGLKAGCVWNIETQGICGRHKLFSSWLGSVPDQVRNL